MTHPSSKTVLITGAGGGFGRQMARQFRAAGSKLVLTDLNDEALNDVARDAGDELVAAVAADLKDQWETLMQLNLLAPMRLCEVFLPGMIERGSGHIVNISSLAGWVGARGMSSYCASKFGLRGFGGSLSADLRGTGVEVTNVYPSFSQTPILDSPQYGYKRKRKVPPHLVSDPAHVVERMITAVRRRKLHVFPDKYARLTYYLLRFAPWVLPMLERRMHNQAIATGQGTE